MTVLKIYKLEDESQTEPISILQNGEHLLGRGDILNCSDKRVSRKHALIIIQDDNVTLKAVHVNPCFYKASKGNIIELISKDQSAILNDGDTFALLADTLWFKVKIDIEEKQAGTKEASYNEEKKEESEPETSLHSISKASQQRDEANINAVLLMSNLENIAQEDFGDNTRKEEVSEDSTESEEETPNREKEEVQNTSHVGKPESEDSNESLDLLDLLSESLSKNNSILTSEIDHGAAQTEENDIEGKCDDTVPKRNLSPVNNPDGDTSNPNDPSTSNTSTKPKRDRCWYGAACYRKNPLHRDSFSHPGDDDYTSDPNNGQPLCPFDPKCYRTNMDHRRQYKHTARPTEKPKKKHSSSDEEEAADESDSKEDTGRRKRKAALKVKKFNETPEDDYDMEDPFINDGSSDDFQISSGDDDESSDEEEDSECMDVESQERKRLLKEAKKFTKARKRKKT